MIPMAKKQKVKAGCGKCPCCGDTDCKDCGPACACGCLLLCDCGKCGNCCDCEEIASPAVTPKT